MCPECSGIGKVMNVNILPMIAPDKSWNEGMVDLPAFHVENWYWKQYTGSDLFDLDKKWRDYTEKERNLLLYGAEEPGGKRVKQQVEGIHNMMSRLLLKRIAQRWVMLPKAIDDADPTKGMPGLPWQAAERGGAFLQGGRLRY